MSDGYRVAAQHQVDEPVLAAALFRTKRGVLVRRSPLPRTFVVAVTPTRLHAFAARGRGPDVQLGDEVAVWERASVQVTAANRRVTIADPRADTEVVCRTGRDGVSRSVVRYMEDPAVVLAA